MTRLPDPPEPRPDAGAAPPRRPVSWTARWRRWLWLAAGGLAVVGVGMELANYVPRIERKLGPRSNPEAADVAADLRALAEAARAYAAEHGAPPATLAELLASPHLDAVPEDPWGRPYRYAGPAGAREFLFFTQGRDRTPGGRGEDADLDHRRLRPTPDRRAQGR